VANQAAAFDSHFVCRLEAMYDLCRMSNDAARSKQLSTAMGCKNSSRQHIRDARQFAGIQFCTTAAVNYGRMVIRFMEIR